MSPSEEIMRIVPDGTELEIEAYVENKDIGFVAAGQPAIVKIESFPFTRYGVLAGTVRASPMTPSPSPTRRRWRATPPRPPSRAFSAAHSARKTSSFR